MVCELKNIVKTYPLPQTSDCLTVLNNVSLSIDKGESVAIVGPSGSGKSTLLHIAAGIDLPSSGNVFIDGCDITKMNERDLAFMRNKKIGVVFQKHYLLPQCTLLENVLLPTLPNSDKKQKSKSLDRAMYLLSRLSIAERLHHKPAQLSGGECQRTAFARALINCPALLCADEPTGSLDQQTALQTGTLLRELVSEEKIALLLVTHSQKLAAMFDKSQTLINANLN